MSAPSAEKTVTFTSIAWKGAYKKAFILLAVLAVAGTVAGASMVPIRPPQRAGTTERDYVPIEVPDHAEPPMKIQISHGFRLVTVPFSGYFAVDDGVEEISYNLTIEDGNGRLVAEDFSRLHAPQEHAFSGSATEETVVVTREHEFSLPPGQYIVEIGSDHPVDYRIEQKSRYFAPGALLLGLGISSFILIGALAMIVLRKRDSLRVSQVAAGPVSGPAAPPTMAPPAAASRATDPRRSSLEYVPPQFFAEFICTACGWSIRNPPVKGIIVCDRCGEMGRLL
ncbi:MAG: hypothetical protein FJ149_00665 [Euryarchaeota archaeon]|nr:hypothetical protein [Euryarchaeota archaeon]